MSKRKMFATRLNEDLLKALKHLAVEQNRRLNDLIEEGIRLVLERYNRPVPEEGKSEK